MFHLIGKQKQITQTLLKQINNPNQKYTNNTFFLSGEMGVGKTYMASYLATQMLKTINDSQNLPGIIVVPSSLIKKWKNVLSEALIANNKKEINIEKFNSKTKKILNNHIYIMSYLLFTKFIKKINHKQQLSFCIIDEIQNCRDAMLNNIKNLPKNATKLFLTGTIFDAIDHLFNLIKTTHPILFNDFSNNTFNSKKETINLFDFINYIWQYISVSISLDDLKSDQEINHQENLIQEIAPIELINTTNEQSLYYQLILSQCQSLKFQPKKAQQIASSFLDDPTQDIIVGKSNYVCRNLSYKNNNFLGITLKDIKIKNTLKYIRLKEIINDNSNKPILIYVTHDEFSKKLAKLLQDDKFKAISILNKNNIDDKINQSFKKYNIIITNPKYVTVGVDIQAEILIWYQLLNNVTNIIQAQRRITRLNSQEKSKVYLLGYNNTFQETMLKEISNSAKNNAATYGFKDKSNLAKLTGILLQNI